MAFTPYMILILLGFCAFMGTLFVVSHWSRAAPPPRLRAAEAPPKPERKAA